MSIETLQQLSWVDAIDGLRAGLYPQVSEKHPAKGKTFMEMSLDTGESHWVERFVENTAFPGFVLALCQVPRDEGLYEVLVRSQSIISMKWLHESFLKEEERPPFGFAAAVTS